MYAVTGATGELGRLVVDELLAIMATRNAGYVRYEPAPYCQRCAVLVGKWFKANTGFQRHPRCFPAGVVVFSDFNYFSVGYEESSTIVHIVSKSHPENVVFFIISAVVFPSPLPVSD